MADYRKALFLIQFDKEGLKHNFLAGDIPCNLGFETNPEELKKLQFLNKKEFKYNYNHGISWDFFKDNAKELGYDATCENFKEMPDYIFNVIFKLKRWDNVKADKIKNQGIANIIAINGILVNLLETLKKFGYVRKYNYSSDIKTNLENSFSVIDEDIDFINKLDAEGKSSMLFDELTKNISKNKLYWISKLYALRTSEKIGLGVGILFISYLSYKFIKR